MKDEIELKPCPFCGEPPYVTNRNEGTNRRYFAINCMNSACYTSVGTASYLTKEEAIKVWNTRKGE